MYALGLRLSIDVPIVKLKESLLDGGLSAEMLDVSLLVLLGCDAMLMCFAGVDRWRRALAREPSSSGCQGLLSL